MTSRHHARIRARLRPLAPLPAGEPAKPCSLANIRGVMFDIYGTMLISGCGEVGTAATEDRDSALVAAWEEVGLAPTRQPKNLLERFDREVARQHAAKRQAGIECPEVDVREVWQRVLQQSDFADVPPERVEDLAVEYELRINPVWPMPGLTECLTFLRHRGICLGIVSNAQFFTPLLFPPLLGHSLDGLGFEAELQFYSFRHGRAKPDNQFFQQAREALERRGIKASEVLYIGNDMLNDVAASVRVGFRTALFAGDQRSLRMRTGDSRVAGVRPDAVLCHWDELQGCLT